jgi:aminoglycoside 2''-phosphotransferase
MSALHAFSSTFLPEPVFHLARSAKAYVQERAALPRYVRQIRAHVPGLSFNQARLINTGFGHAVVILDEAWVFRFPRNERRRRVFCIELRLLEELRKRTPVALPDYRHVAQDGLFGAYPMIGGKELSPALFATLDRAMQENVMDQYAQVLGALHGLPAGFAAHEGLEERKPITSASAHDWYFNVTRSYLGRKVDPALLSSMDRFYKGFRARPPFPARLINGDLDDNHLLLDGGTLGIIDFGDIVVGDPALDFAMLHFYPEWVMPFVFDRYVFRDEQRDLPERARWHAARRLCDRLWFAYKREGQIRPIDETVRRLSLQFARLGL